ncbi:MAG: hypothetical protein K6D03_10145 [Solobacterium sp.]|nr:hypothetical protein [Solobacterium sp.]
MCKTFEEIMSEIAAGLTGNNGEDLQYLISKEIEYSSHPYGKEITRAIGRLQYRILPEEIRDRVDEKTSENLAALRKKLEQADLCIFRKEYGQAEKIIEPMIRETEDAGLFIDDEVSEYHVFDDLFEEIIYIEMKHPEKKIMHAPFPYHEIYLRFGSLMIDMGRYEEARNALEKALRWNPVSSGIWLEYAEVFKYLKMTDELFRTTKELFQYAYQPEYIAKCYRNFGYCLIEEKKYRDAVICYFMSLMYDSESMQAEEELMYIRETAGIEPALPSQEDIIRLCRTYGIPSGPNPEVYDMAYSAGQMMIEKNDYRNARYFLEIAYRLRPTDENREMLERLKMN